jgi:hypothetical protein
LAQKFPAYTHKLAVFHPLLLGFLRVPAMLEQREANPLPAFWRLGTGAQASM